MVGHNFYSQIIDMENLYLAWLEFRKDKRNKYDVQYFEKRLENNLFALHSELVNKKYCHLNYTSFYVTDPKLRHIHKANVRDRILHHAVYRILYPLFDKNFIYDSYSCRISKGTHKAVSRLDDFIRKVSKSYTKPCYVLKCDIRKFFDSVDHSILMGLIKRKIEDKDCLWLIQEIIDSFKRPIVQLELFERERERDGRALRTRNTDRQSHEPAFRQYLSS